MKQDMRANPKVGVAHSVAALNRRGFNKIKFLQTSNSCKPPNRRGFLYTAPNPFKTLSEHLGEPCIL